MDAQKVFILSLNSYKLGIFYIKVYCFGQTFFLQKIVWQKKFGSGQLLPTPCQWRIQKFWIKGRKGQGWGLGGGCALSPNN